MRPANGLAGGAQNARETEQSLLIHLVSAEQIRVVAEIPQKPIQFPERLLGAVESSGNLAGGEVLGLEDREAEDEERFLRMPAIVGPIHANQEHAFQEVVRCVMLPHADQGNVVS